MDSNIEDVLLVHEGSTRMNEVNRSSSQICQAP